MNIRGLSELIVSSHISEETEYSVCVCVYRFIYPGRDLNLNTHRLMGTRVTVGTGTKAYKSYSFFFEKVKMQKVSCKG